MQEKVRDAFFVILFQTLLDTYGKLFPKRLSGNREVPKRSLEFSLYIKLVNAYVYTLKRIEERGRPFALKLQERRLRKILAVADTTTWWRAYFVKNDIRVPDIKNLKDFQQIPPINRFDLLDAAKEDLLTLPADDDSIVWRRSGGSTTGTPFVWGLNKSLLYLNVLAHFIKELQNGGFPFEQYARENFYMDYNWPHGFIRSEFRWFSRGDFTVRTDEAEASKKIADLSQIITDLGTAVVRTSPGELPFLIQELKEQDLHPPISFLTITGNILEENMRRLAVDYLGCKVIVHYGSQEMGPLTIECERYHGFYHLFSERALIEILNSKGEAVAPGTVGNITVTCLDNTAMPLIRYQPGDLGILHHNKTCACENTSPLLEIRSRTTDVIKFSNGEEKPARRILRQFNREPFVSTVRRFQVRQDALDEIVILLEVREHIAEKFIAALKEKLSLLYKGMLTVQVRQTSSIPQDGPKFKVFAPFKN